jgi:hypothetical protein
MPEPAITQITEQGSRRLAGEMKQPSGIRVESEFLGSENKQQPDALSPLTEDI